MSPIRSTALAAILLWTLAAALLVPGQALAQVLINGTLLQVDLFGVRPLPPAAPVSGVPVGPFVANQTAGGALSVTVPQPQSVSFLSSTAFPSGVVLTIKQGWVLSGIGTGMLVNGFQPGGNPQPTTINPSTNLPGTTIPLTPNIFHLGYKGGGGFGGTLKLLGYFTGDSVFQTTPGVFLRQFAFRANRQGHSTGAADQQVVPMTFIEAPLGNVLAAYSGNETRWTGPWTTGSISVVALFGNLAPYGGAGKIGTPSQVTSPINFRTVAGFDGRTMNTALGTLTGTLNLVSPNISIGSPGLLSPYSYVSFWTLDLDIVPEPTSTVMLGCGLLAVGLLAWRRRGH
jgi:hypothetical protein